MINIYILLKKKSVYREGSGARGCLLASCGVDRASFASLSSGRRCFGWLFREWRDLGGGAHLWYDRVHAVLCVAWGGVEIVPYSVGRRGCLWPYGAAEGVEVMEPPGHMCVAVKQKM